MRSVNTKTQIMRHKTQKNKKIEKIVSNSTLKMTELAKFKIVLMIHKANQKIRQIRHEIKDPKDQLYKMNLSI